MLETVHNDEYDVKYDEGKPKLNSREMGVAGGG